MHKKSTEPPEVIDLSSGSNNEAVHRESSPLVTELVHTTGRATVEDRVAPLAVNPPAA